MHEFTESEGELLARLSSLVIERPLIERRREIRKSLLKIAINECEINKEYDLQEISIQLRNITKCTLSDEQILQTLSELENENLVKHLHSFKYRIISKPDILSFENLLYPVWNEFSIFLREKFPQYDPFIHNNTKKIFDSVIRKILTRLSISNPSFNQESFPSNDIEEDIKEEIKGVHLPNKLDEKLPELLVQYLNSKPPKLNSFIFDCYYGLINVDLVAREQEIPDIDFGNEIEFLIVDTNFIVPLMCQYDNVHPLSIAIIKQCNKLKVPLYYTSKTKAEIWRLIRGSQSLMEGLNKQNIDPSSNQFASDYAKTNINWSIYYTYLTEWEQFILKEYSLNQLLPAMEQNVEEKTYEIVKQSLIFADNFRFEERSKRETTYKPRIRSEENYAHDAYCVGLVSFLRKNKITTNKKLGPWFLTYDNLLSYLNFNSIMNDDDLGLVIQPRILLNYLLAYSKIEFNDEDRADVAVALITLTTKTKNQELTLEEYSKLVAAKLDLGINNSELIRKIIICSPLRDELKKALSHGSEEGPDTITYNIFTSPEIEKIVEKIISQEKANKENEQERIKLKEQLRKVSEALLKEQAAKEALENSNKEANNITLNVSIKNTVTAEINIDQNVPPKVRTLIQLLENEGAFLDNRVEKPPNHLSLEKAKSWIGKVRDTIDNSMEIKEDIKAILPYMNAVLQSLQYLN